MTGCPLIIHRLCASPSPSGSAPSLLLSDYRGVPTTITAQPGRRHRHCPPRSAALSLSRNRARSPRTAGHSNRSFLRYASALALGNTCRRLTVVRGSRWGGGGLCYAQTDSRGIPGTGQRGQGSSHQLAVLWSDFERH